MHGINYYTLKVKKPKKPIGYGEARIFNKDKRDGGYIWHGVWRDPNQKCDRCGAPVTYDPNMGMCEPCKAIFAKELKHK